MKPWKPACVALILIFAAIAVSSSYPAPGNDPHNITLTFQCGNTTPVQMHVTGDLQIERESLMAANCSVATSRDQATVLCPPTIAGHR